MLLGVAGVPGAPGCGSPVRLAVVGGSTVITPPNPESLQQIVSRSSGPSCSSKVIWGLGFLCVKLAHPEARGASVSL